MQNPKKLILSPGLIPFFTSFVLVALFIFPLPTLIGEPSADSYSIWQTILTFRSEKITSSYVLYKGFLAVYPYIWFYELSNFLKLDDFFFIKIYHALLFSYVAAIGIPSIISKVLSVEIKLYKNIIFVTLLFYMTRFTGIFEMIMVDLPTWAFFVAAIQLIIFAQKSTKKGFAYLFSGIFTGLTLCSSGQYSLAGYILIAYSVFATLTSVKHAENRAKINHLLILALFLFGVVAPKVYDSHFHDTVVQPMRDRGDWLPTGREWLYSGMTRLLPHYKHSYPQQSNRGLAILKRTEGDKFPERYERIKLGGGTYSTAEYLRILKSNPLDFGVMWATKTFITLSFDGGKARIPHLLISYTSLFICLLLIFWRCTYFRDLANLNTLILLSIIATIAAPVFLFIDMRYAVALHGFVLGFALHQAQLSQNLKRFASRVFSRKEEREALSGENVKIPYPAIMYVIFIALCFTLYGALLEIPGSDPSKVLFKW